MRLRSLGHIERMPKYLLHGHIIGVRKKGIPRKIWLQDMEQDIGRMRIRGSKQQA